LPRFRSLYGPVRGAKATLLFVISSW